jgi:FkbM family methyltransferase
MVKETLKEALLGLGLYYRINDFRFRHDSRNISQKEFYARFIGPDDLVFDVGANVGQRSKIFAELARKVVAVEPQAHCLRHLKSRFMFNSRVVIESVAVGEKEGEAVMWESDSHPISSMSRRFIDTMGQGTFRNEKWEKEIRVPTKTLDQLITMHGLPKWLKIDVEGYELNVLKGLTQPVPFISFEYTPELLTETAACIERIHQISSHYHYNYCLGEDLEFVLPGHVNYSTFVQENMPLITTLDTFGDIYAILN